MLCYKNKIDVKFTNVSLTSYVKLTLINKTNISNITLTYSDVRKLIHFM